MKDLNVRQEAIKILKEKAGKNLFDLGCSNFLLNMPPEARETKAKIGKWDHIKLKNFCTGAILIKIMPAFFTELEQTILKFLWKQKTPNSQSNLEKENQSKRHHNPGLQAILQSCNHQDNMVLAQEQTLRLIEQNRAPINGPTNLWSTNI